VSLHTPQQTLSRVPCVTSGVLTAHQQNQSIHPRHNTRKLRPPLQEYLNTLLPGALNAPRPFSSTAPYWRVHYDRNFQVTQRLHRVEVLIITSTTANRRLLHLCAAPEPLAVKSESPTVCNRRRNVSEDSSKRHFALSPKTYVSRYLKRITTKLQTTVAI
jgi:hypothetical protein